MRHAKARTHLKFANGVIELESYPSSRGIYRLQFDINADGEYLAADYSEGEVRRLHEALGEWLETGGW
jgi:hypothetical protein